MHFDNFNLHCVALRKESVDRNCTIVMVGLLMFRSLSARRAWIEMDVTAKIGLFTSVALRKESVDRNPVAVGSLITLGGRSPQGERG